MNFKESDLAVLDRVANAARNVPGYVNIRDVFDLFPTGSQLRPVLGFMLDGLRGYCKVDPTEFTSRGFTGPRSFEAWQICRASGLPIIGTRVRPVQQGRKVLRPRLAELDLAGQDLSGFTFMEVDMRGVSFRNCALRGAIFEATDARDAVFAGADLEGSRALRCGGHRVKEIGNFVGASFRACNLRGANFRGADLRHADFASADLEGLDARGARLLDATWDNSTGEPLFQLDQLGSHTGTSRQSWALRDFGPEEVEGLRALRSDGIAAEDVLRRWFRMGLAEPSAETGIWGLTALGLEIAGA